MSDNSLAIIQDAGLLAQADMTALAGMASELRQTWETAQVFRTRTEMAVSVLNDIKHPTPDSKYWQAVREQDVFLNELVSLSYEYRKVALQLRRLRRDLIAEQDEIEQEALALEIEHQEWIAAQMQRTARHRVREIGEWSRIKAELEPLLAYGADDVDAHQIEAMTRRFDVEERFVTDHTPVAEARNAIGLAKTARRIKREAGP